MDTDVSQRNNYNNRTWICSLEIGREQLGNLSANYDFLKRTGLLGPGQAVLEVGCGTGALCRRLTEDGLSVIGSDVAQAAIEFGRSKYPDLELHVQDAEELPWPEAQFDRVLSFDMLEHLHHPDRHIEQVARILKPGGYYLLQTPNKWSNMVFETVRTRSMKWKRYHPSLHSPSQLRRRLGRFGFEVSFMKVNVVNEFTLKKLSGAPVLQWLFRHIPFEKLPLCLQTNLYVIAHRVN